MIRTWGADQAGRLRQRLDDLRAAPNLGVMRQVKRSQELKGDRRARSHSTSSTRTVSSSSRPNAPVPAKPNGGLDWDAVTAVRVLEIADTHE